MQKANKPQGQEIDLKIAARTSEFHVGDDDLFADAGERVLIFKQILVVWPLAHRCQELDGIAHQL